MPTQGAVGGMPSVARVRRAAGGRSASNVSSSTGGYTTHIRSGEIPSPSRFSRVTCEFAMYRVMRGARRRTRRESHSGPR